MGSDGDELVSARKEKTIHLIMDVMACKKVGRRAKAVETKLNVKVKASQVGANTSEHSITA